MDIAVGAGFQVDHGVNSKIRQWCDVHAYRTQLQIEFCELCLHPRPHIKHACKMHTWEIYVCSLYIFLKIKAIILRWRRVTGTNRPVCVCARLCVCLWNSTPSSWHELAAVTCLPLPCDVVECRDVTADARASQQLTRKPNPCLLLLPPLRCAKVEQLWSRRAPGCQIGPF